jgi:hypothetical protein
MAAPWDAHLKPLSGQCEKERSDVNIRMEGLLVSCRANEALLALPTRQGKDQRRGGKCPARTI